MTSRPALLFYCQHAMGMGHLVRSLALAEALSHSFRVVLLNGGELPRDVRLPEEIEIVNLPALRLDDGQLVSCDNRYTLTRAKKARTVRILDSFRKLRPEVLLTELYPFGRKKFEFELVPLLDEAKSQGAAAPLIVCSLRDILVSRQSNQERFEERAVAAANRWFDVVLVHSDPCFARLEESFHPRTRLTPAIYHTGFVVGQRSGSQSDRSGQYPVVISAGGGFYGFQLFHTALEAHALLSQTAPISMKIIAGPFLPAERWEALQDAARDRQGVTLVRSVPNLYAELGRARASVSQCGYNTALEIVQTQVPALVVPFADGGEDEQLNRAWRLESLGAVLVLDQKEMTAERMADEMRKLIEFQPRTVDLDFDGARRSTEILLELLSLRQLRGISHHTRELLKWQV